MKGAAFFLICCFFLSGTLYSAMKLDHVLSDMKNPTNLIDGNENSFAEGKPGTNVMILQFGNLKYLKEIRILLREPVKFKYFQISSSENFIEWSNIIEKKDVESAVLAQSLENRVSSFIKIVIVSDKAFAVGEILVSDTAAPSNRVTELKISDVREESAQISWKTRVKSQGTVSFTKKMNGTKQTVMEADFRSEHSVRLQGLQKGTEYLVQIISQSPDGTRIDSDEMGFVTKGTPLPEIWELKGVSITPFTAKISYWANIPVSYEVQLGTSEKNIKKIISEKKPKDKDAFDILGLQPETQYFYKLVLSDKSGNVTMTPAISFQTPAYNIALGKKVVGTFNNIDEGIRKLGYGESIVDKLVDGNLNYFGGMAISYNADHSDQYVVIDLEKPEPIKRLDLYWWAMSFSRDFRIDLSNDGKDWQTVAGKLDAMNGTRKASPGGDAMMIQTVPMNKTARFVRLYVQAGAARGTVSTKWPPKPNLYMMEIAVIKDVTRN